MYLFRIGVVAMLSLAIGVAATYRPAYQMLDTLVILAVGMMLGVAYMKGIDRIHNYFTAKQE
jgi:hypothetical protein